MIVYHGSCEIVEKPDVMHSFCPLDFGKGFYVTTIKEQTERWAKRKADLFGKSQAVVSVYQMQVEYGALAVKRVCLKRDVSRKTENKIRRMSVLADGRPGRMYPSCNHHRRYRS